VTKKGEGGKGGVDVGSEAHEATLQAAQAGAQPRKQRRQGKAVDGVSAAPGKARKPHAKQKRAPGKVVAIGVDVPKLDELKAEEMGGPRVGRPESYHPRYAEIARAMCRLGATDFDLACEFGVKTQTILNWRCKYPEFLESTLEGKEAFDNRAERSLAMRAVGYSYHSEKVFQYEGQIIRAATVEHCPPDVSAIRLWLMNRRPDKWRDKSELKLDSSDAFLKLWTAISDGTIGQARQEVA
jgi:hypothetical protein